MKRKNPNNFRSKWDMTHKSKKDYKRNGNIYDKAELEKAIKEWENMGLDNYWRLPEGVKEPVFKPPLKLCGGLCSSNGVGSFRGKVYASLIKKLTNYDLYKTLTYESLFIITIILEKEVEKNKDKKDNDNYNIIGECGFTTIRELRDLYRMFKAYTELGAILIPWY